MVIFVCRNKDSQYSVLFLIDRSDKDHNGLVIKTLSPEHVVQEVTAVADYPFMLKNMTVIRLLLICKIRSSSSVIGLVARLLSLLSDPTERFSSLRDATDVELKRFSTPGAGSSKKSGSD